MNLYKHIFKRPGFQANFQEILNEIEKIGSIKINANYQVEESNHEVVFQVLATIFSDEIACKEYDLDPSKGFILNGPVGCGKTSLLQILRNTKPMTFPCRWVTARKIALDYLKSGVNPFEDYGEKCICCIDDLGMESQAVKHFGTKLNVLEELLLTRYDNCFREGFKTYITTNLNSTLINEIYGPHVRSRLREMCNVISFPNNSPDKRS